MTKSNEISAIKWNSRGDGFTIRGDLLGSQVMSADGKATRFPRFLWQLCYDGFRKSQRWSRVEPSIQEYSHPNFIKNNLELRSLRDSLDSSAQSRLPSHDPPERAHVAPPLNLTV